MSSKASFDLLATNREYGDVCEQIIASLSAAARQHVRIHVAKTWDDVQWQKIKLSTSPLIVVSRLADIGVGAKRHPARRHRRHYVFTEGMPSEAIAARLSGLSCRHCTLHLDGEPRAENRTKTVARMVQWYVSHDFVPIVDAWWERVDGGEFVAISPQLERVSVNRASICQALKSQDVDSFEIDCDGSFVFWPKIDGHLGWNQLKMLADPMAAAKSKAKNADFCRRYGQAMKQLRQRAGLSQADVHGITDRQLRRYESGLGFPTRKSLALIASAHGLSLNDYLAALAKQT